MFAYQSETGESLPWRSSCSRATLAWEKMKACTAAAESRTGTPSVSERCPATRLAQLMLCAALKDDLISSFQQQMSGRDEHIAALNAELNACYVRLAESDALVERFDFLWLLRALF
jgi:hypothetical protein